MLATLSILAPLIPIFIGMLLKLAFIDEVPTDRVQQQKFIVTQYARPLWTDLIVAALILPIGFLVSDKLSKRATTAVYVIPVGAFVACTVAFLIQPKFGWDEMLWRIVIPDFLGLLCLLVMGMVIYRSAK